MSNTANRLHFPTPAPHRPPPADPWFPPPQTVATDPSGPDIPDHPAAPLVTGEPVVTVAEAAFRLKVSEKTVHRRLRDGGLRKVALGGRAVRIAVAELDRLIGGRTTR